MKLKITQFSIFLLLFSFSLNAQKSNEVGFRYGIGLNFISGDNSSTTENKFTFLNFTGIFNHNFSNLFSLQPEFQVFQTGYNITLKNGQVATKYSNTESYLGLNLLPKVNLRLTSGSISFYTGPSLNLLVNAISNYEFNGFSTGGTNIQNIKPFLANWILGGSLNLNFSPKDRFVIDMRYNFGLTNINRNVGINKISQMGMGIGYQRVL